MAVKGLDAEARAAIPQGDSLVPGSSADVVGKRLPADAVDRVYMTTECLAAAERLSVPEASGVIHRATHEEIAGVVIGDAPDGLGVVSKGVCTRGAAKVPELDG